MGHATPDPHELVEHLTTLPFGDPGTRSPSLTEAWCPACSAVCLMPDPLVQRLDARDTWNRLEQLEMRRGNQHLCHHLVQVFQQQRSRVPVASKVRSGQGFLHLIQSSVGVPITSHPALQERLVHLLHDAIGAELRTDLLSAKSGETLLERPAPPQA